MKNEVVLTDADFGRRERWISDGLEGRVGRIGCIVPCSLSALPATSYTSQNRFFSTEYIQ